MPKIEIDVDHILTSAVALEIEPGDHLLVMNGVVIGMVEKRARKPTLTIEAKPDDEAPQKRAPRMPPPENLTTTDIMDTLRRFEIPMTTKQIIDTLAAQRKETFPESHRRHIANLIRHLHDQRKIGKTEEDLRFPKYRLLP